MTERKNTIAHLDFHIEDFRAWRQGKSFEEVGRITDAISEASEQGDEAFLEQFPFIDRIIYTDGTWRKVIRGSGKLDG